ncbi:MAG: hypothetical protein HC906_18025 [Bacteroidales bacterium]|nr:hypothetical protein [Bacteroidales bacterium]
MFLKLFKSDRPITLFLIPFFTFLLWIPELYSDQVMTFHFDVKAAPLYLIFNDIPVNNPFLSRIVAFVFNLIISLLLVRLNSKFFFIPARTNLPAFIYLFIVSTIPALQRFNPVILATLLFLITIDRVLTSYKFEGTSFHYFDASLFIGISALFYLPSVYFILFVWAGLASFRPFKWREWMFTLVGFLLPFLFLFTYFFWTKAGFLANFNQLMINLKVQQSVFELSLYFKLFVLLMILFILIASIHLMSNYTTRKIQTRKFYMFFLLIFLISIFLYVTVSSIGLEIIYITAIPVTYLISHFFVFVKTKFIHSVLFMLFLLSVVACCYYNLVMGLFT